MIEIEQIKEKFLKKIQNLDNLEIIKEIKAEFLGKKSKINDIFKNIVNLEEEEKKLMGDKINQLRIFITEKLNDLEQILLQNKIDEQLKKETIDVTLPHRLENKGYIHAISYVIKEIGDILHSMGFSNAQDSEIQNDWFCFEGLNFPQFHPARQMQDTFFLNNNKNNEKILLRTHTTSFQIKEFTNTKPPYKIYNIGKTFRSEMDATHAPMFHQFDTAFVDENITIQDLKDCLITFFKKFFNLKNVPLRFRPSFFPFTSPSIEIDIKCNKKKEGQLVLGEGNDWMEVLGGGMIHPNVLKNGKVDIDKYQGFAFGGGVERMAMLKYSIRDIRNLYDGDVRFLHKYGFTAAGI